MFQSQNLGFGKTPTSNTGSKCHNCITTIQTDVSSSGEVHVTTKDTTNANGVTNTTAITSTTNSTNNTQPNLTACIDWLQGTVKFADFKQFESCVEFVVSYLKDTAYYEFGQPRFMGKTWQNHGKSAKGILFYWDKPNLEVNELGHGFISIPASVLSQVSADDIWRMMSGLLDCYKFKCTRLDIAIDDYNKTVSFEELDNAVELGNRTGFENYDVKASYRKKVIGRTRYMGSAKSNSMLRYYDKSVESRGKVDAYRWELQLIDEKAQSVFIQYAQMDREAFSTIGHRYLGSVVFGSVNFIDRSTGKRASRCEQLTWWKNLVNMIGSIQIAIPRVVKTLEKTVETIRKQYAPILCAVKRGLGKTGFRFFMNELVDSGENRQGKRHEAITKQIQWENEGRQALEQNVFCST